MKYLTSIRAAESRYSGLKIAISRIFETESTLEAADRTACRLELIGPLNKLPYTQYPLHCDKE